VTGNAVHATIVATAKKCTTNIALAALVVNGTMNGTYQGTATCSKDTIVGTLSLAR
jgi:hypothetical protein